jgi:hypothetical protein
MTGAFEAGNEQGADSASEVGGVAAAWWWCFTSLRKRLVGSVPDVWLVPRSGDFGNRAISGCASNLVAETRALGFTPHAAQNVSGNRRSAIDGRTTRHTGHEVSMRIRKRVCRRTLRSDHVHRRRAQAALHQPQRNRAWFKINAAVYNLIHITALDTRPAPAPDLPDQQCTGPGHEPPVRNRPHHPTLSE